MIDIDRILLEVEKYVPEYGRQISLQTVPGNIDPAYGTGRMTALHHPESAFTEPMFPQMEYTNKIIKDLGLVRTRLMKLHPYQCYTYHVDATPRIHIPLITNKNCFMVLDDIVERYPADGNHYWVDTTKMHTFVNASTEVRIHIVGGVSN